MGGRKKLREFHCLCRVIRLRKSSVRTILPVAILNGFQDGEIQACAAAGGAFIPGENKSTYSLERGYFADPVTERAWRLLIFYVFHAEPLLPVAMEKRVVLRVRLREVVA